MVKKILGKSYIYFVLLFMYLPIIILVIYSFQDTTAIKFGTFNTPTFKLYQDLFDMNIRQTAEIWNAVGNTLLIAFSAVACSIVSG